MNRRIVWYARFCGVLQAGGVLLLGLLVYSKSMGASVERVVVSGRGCSREFMTSRRSSSLHTRRRQWRGARVQAASAVVARSARDPADFEARAEMPEGSAGWNARRSSCVLCPERRRILFEDAGSRHACHCFSDSSSSKVFCTPMC